MKKCSKCKVEKPRSAFRKRARNKDGLTGQCAECLRRYEGKWLSDRTPEHRRRLNATRRARRKAVYQRLLEFLADRACGDCGEPDSVVLEFDHAGSEKTANVSDMSTSGFSWQRIEVEIEKCDIVCANCHRRRTAVEQGWSIIGV